MIAGVLLVINSSRGYQLVFKYPSDFGAYENGRRALDEMPPERPESSADDFVGFFPDTRSEDFDDTINTPGPGKTGVPNRLPKDLLTSEANAHFLADILSPKPLANDRFFSLSFDGASFVGHPIFFTHAMMEAVRKHIRQASGSTPSVFLHPPMSAGSAGSISSASVAKGTGLESPKRTANSQTQQPISTLDSVQTPTPTSPGSSSSTEPDASQRISISMFHVIFLIRHDNVPHQNLVHLQHCVHSDLAMPLSKALQHEQFRSDYVREQCEMILKLKESVDHDSFFDAIHEKSSLVQLMKRVTDAVILQPVRGNLHGIRVNDHIPLSLCWKIDSKHGYDELVPFKALLLEKSADEISSLVGPNPDFDVFLRIASHRRSLEDIRRKVGWSWEHVSAIARQLIDCQLARPVYPITTDTIFVLHPRAQLDAVFQYASEVRSKYPTIDLPMILSRMTGHPHRLGDLVTFRSEESRVVYMNIIAHMVSQRYLAYHTTYLHLFFKGDRVLPEQVLDVLPEMEQELISNDNLTQPELDMFWRLFQYLFGEHSVDEVCWMEKIARKDLLQFVEAFHDFIVPVQFVEE